MPDCDMCVAEYKERWKHPLQRAPRWSWLGDPQPSRWPRPDCADANPTCPAYDAMLMKLSKTMPQEANKLADIRDEMVRRGEHRRPVIGRSASRVCKNCDRLDCEARWWPNKEEREKACPNAHPAAAARAQQRRQSHLAAVPDPRLPPEKDD